MCWLYSGVLPACCGLSPILHLPPLEPYKLFLRQPPQLQAKQCPVIVVINQMQVKAVQDAARTLLQSFYWNILSEDVAP